MSNPRNKSATRRLPRRTLFAGIVSLGLCQGHIAIMIGVRLVKLLLERMPLAAISERFLESQNSVVIGVGLIKLRLGPPRAGDIPLRPGNLAIFVLVRTLKDIGN